MDNLTPTERNRRHMTHVMAALADGDRRPFADSFADDFRWVMRGTTTWSGTYDGKEAVYRDLMQPLFAQFANDYRNHATRILADGDWVVVECRGEVTTVRGDPYDNSYCYLCRFDADGRMKELIEYMDTELVTRALGARR